MGDRVRAKSDGYEFVIEQIDHPEWSRSRGKARGGKGNLWYDFDNIEPAPREGVR